MVLLESDLTFIILSNCLKFEVIQSEVEVRTEMKSGITSLGTIRAHPGDPNQQLSTTQFQV